MDTTQTPKTTDHSTINPEAIFSTSMQPEGTGNFHCEISFKSILSSELSKNPHVKAEFLSNIILDSKDFPHLIQDLKDRLYCPAWTNLAQNATTDFERLEIDLVVKISLRSDDDDEPKKTVFIPYDMESEEEGYELNLENGPVIVYFAVISNPDILTEKIWLIEKTITLQGLLATKKAGKEDVLIPESPIKTELKVKIDTLREWLSSSCLTFYSVVSTLKNIKISLGDLFYDIRLEPELEKEMQEMRLKNDFRGMIEKFKDIFDTQENATEKTAIDEMLREGRLLILHADISVDFILRFVAKEYKKMKEELTNTKKKNDEDIKETKLEIEKIREKQVELENAITALAAKVDMIQEELNGQTMSDDESMNVPEEDVDE